MLGIGALSQLMAAEQHLSKLAHLVSDLLISLFTSQLPFDEVKRAEALKAAHDLLDFAERHAGKPESDFELSRTTADQIPPVRKVIARIVARKPISDEQISMTQKFFFGISQGFSVRMRGRGGCVNGLPST